MAAAAHQPAHHGTDWSLYARYGLAGSVCASSAHMILVPIDVVKTRLQVDKGRYNGMFDAFGKMYQTEGAGSLLLGFRPTMAGYLLQGAAKFGLFELFKTKLTATLGEDTAAQYPLGIYFASSMSAETFASLLLTPFEALRIRVVSQPTFGSGIISGMSKLFTTEGVGGLYRGFPPLLGKQLPYTVVQLSAFTFLVEQTYSYLEQTKGITKESVSKAKQLVVSMGCGVVAGVLSSLASQPGDTILSRINMAAKTGKGRRTVGEVYSELGFRGLWLGTGARCVFTGLLSATIFLVYDSIKIALGLPTTSGIKKKIAHPLPAAPANAVAAVQPQGAQQKGSKV